MHLTEPNGLDGQSFAHDTTIQSLVNFPPKS